MQALSKDTPTVEHFGTIFVAIELSRQRWLVTMHCPDRDKISHHRLEGGDHAGLLALIDRMRERVARRLGRSGSALAKACGVPRTRSERIASEETAITADTALRLGKALGTSA